VSEEQVGSPRRHRSRAEAEQLLVEFEASGMSRVEFCQKHGLALTTLARYQKRRRQAQGQDTGSGRWVAVELSTPQPARSGLTLVLAGGRRIEVDRGFDSPTLPRLLSLLEPA
jgi:hypothetical protein